MTTLWKVIVDLISSIETKLAFLCFMGVHLPGAVKAALLKLLPHFHSVATQRIEQVWTADKRQACNSPFCMSDFDKFVCLRKLEVIKAEQKRLLSIFRKTHMLFFNVAWLFCCFCCCCLGWFFFFFSVKKWIFILTSFSFNPGIQETWNWNWLVLMAR